MSRDKRKPSRMEENEVKRDRETERDEDGKLGTLHTHLLCGWAGIHIGV